jgi:hypothetical protein
LVLLTNATVREKDLECSWFQSQHLSFSISWLTLSCCSQVSTVDCQGIKKKDQMWIFMILFIIALYSIAHTNGVF